MAKFTIYSSDGQTARYEGKLRYNGIFGGVSYVEFSQIASPTLIDFHVGDYVDYSRTGFRYRLYNIPRPTKRSGNNTVGDTYVYKNVKLFCATKDLELAPFRDLVLNDNLIHFTTLPTISVYDDVYGIADRIQACMDDYAGSGVWNITVMNTTDPVVLGKLGEEKEYSVSGVSCLEALNEIYKLWSGIGWVYSVVNGVNTITLGRPNVQTSDNTTDEFSYGLGNGLTVIAQAESTKTEMATRLYVYGSDRNMPPRYYNNISPSIFSAESVYIPNLMIPPSEWGTTSSKRDARKAFVEDVSAIGEYGLIPKTIYFDGSGDYEEIYPSLEDMTFSELRAAMPVGTQYRPSSAYPNSDYVNTIKAVTNPTDDGVLEDAGAKYAESGTASWVAIDEDFPYAGHQNVVNCNPGGTLVSYTAAHTGKLKANFPVIFTVECDDMIDVTANIVVTVNGASKQIVPLQVDRRSTTAIFETAPVTQDVEAGDVVGIVIGVETRLMTGNEGGDCHIEADAGTAYFNVQYTIGDTFTLVLKQIGFDIAERGGTLSNGLATISMKSGMCGGRDFVVKSCKYSSAGDEWILQCYRQKDDALGQYFPNSIYPLEAGDYYVLVDMMMPEVYIGASQERLLERGRQVLASMSHPKIIYTPEIDAKVLALAPEPILEGMYMPVYDENLIETTVEAYPHTTWVLISSLVISEDEDAIPLYKITLQDEKADSFLQSYSYEMGKRATRVRIDEMEAKRSSYQPEGEEGIAAVPYLEITSSSEFFTYPAGASQPVEGTITMQAIPHDIPNPTYQWYHNGTSGWAALSGATDQAFEVDPNSSVYYPDDDLVAEFKVVVIGGGVTYDAYKTIVKLTGGGGGTPGEDAISIMLSNTSHVFPAGADGYAYQANDQVRVLAFKGTTQIATSVGTISGTVSGLTVTKINNNSTDTTLSVNALNNPKLNQAGSLTIPVTAGGVTMSLRYGWALAIKGAKGDPGDPGDPGEPGPPIAYLYQGVWDSSKVYYGNNVRRDIVKYRANESADYVYYMAVIKSGEGEIFDDTPPPSSSDWEAFGASYSSVATGFLFSEEASIDEATIYNAIIQNLMTQDNGNGTIVAEGNALTMFDSSGNPRMKVSGDNIAPIPTPEAGNFTVGEIQRWSLSGTQINNRYTNTVLVEIGEVDDSEVPSGANKLTLPNLTLSIAVPALTSGSGAATIRAGYRVDAQYVGSMNTATFNPSGTNGTMTVSSGSCTISANTVHKIYLQLELDYLGEDVTVSSSYAVRVESPVAQWSLSFIEQITEIGPNGFRVQNASNGIEVTSTTFRMKISGTWYAVGTATVSGNTVLRLIAI